MEREEWTSTTLYSHSADLFLRKSQLCPYNAHITVHADCEHEGIKTVAHVGVDLKDIWGKSIAEIIEIFDREVDEYIACRVRNRPLGSRRCLTPYNSQLSIFNSQLF
jgi:hypothetical protein